MTTEHGDTRNALRSLDQQRADTLADALRPDAAPTGDDAEIRRALDDCTLGKWTTCLGADLYVAVSDGTEEGSRSDVLATIAVEHATSPRQTADAWLMAQGKAHAAEVLRLREERSEISAECVKLRARLVAASQRADDAVEVLVTEVERAQTAERRAAELTAHVEDLRDTVCNLLAEIGDPAHLCNAVPECTMHATWECADDGYSTGACDAHREGRAGEWHPAPRTAVLCSLDGVSR